METRWHSPPEKFRFRRRVNRVHLAVAGRQDEIFPGRHRRFRVAEKIDGEEHKQRPEARQSAGQGQEMARRGCAASQATASSASSARPDQPMSLSAASEGFSRVFHGAQNKFFCRHLQFGIFSAFWLPPR